MKPKYAAKKKYRIDGDENAITIRETKGSGVNFTLALNDAHEVLAALRETLEALEQKIQEDADALEVRKAAANLAKPALLASKMSKRPSVAAAPPVVVQEIPVQYVWRVVDGVKIDATEAPEWATRVGQVQLTPNLTLRAWVNDVDTQYQYLPGYAGVNTPGKVCKGEFIEWDWDAEVSVIATLEEIE